MIVAIHQPHYLPWLRYMHKMASCDVFVLLDDTQYEKNGWQNRNKIKGPNGPILLTVPVRHASFRPICEVEINPQTAWQEKHWKSLLTCYGKAPYFRRYAPALEDILAAPWERLAALNVRAIRRKNIITGSRNEIRPPGRSPLRPDHGQIMTGARRHLGHLIDLKSRRRRALPAREFAAAGLTIEPWRYRLDRVICEEPNGRRSNPPF